MLFTLFYDHADRVVKALLVLNQKGARPQFSLESSHYEINDQEILSLCQTLKVHKIFSFEYLISKMKELTFLHLFLYMLNIIYLIYKYYVFNI